MCAVVEEGVTKDDRHPLGISAYLSLLAALFTTGQCYFFLLLFSLTNLLTVESEE